MQTRECSQSLVASWQQSEHTECLALLDDRLNMAVDKRAPLFLVDSEFCDQVFLNDLDRRNMHYLIALRLNQP